MATGNSQSQARSVSPALAVVCIIVAIGVIAFIGMRVLAFGRPKPSEASAPPLRTEQTINGQKVPANAPSYYWTEHQGGQGGQGAQGQPATSGP